MSDHGHELGYRIGGAATGSNVPGIASVRDGGIDVGGTDHSASRRLDVLALEAPHLIAPSGELAHELRRAHDAGAALRAALNNARIEHAQNGAVSEESWRLLALLVDQLAERLGELERAERAAGRR